MKISRRRFLGGAAAVSGATLLGPLTNARWAAAREPWPSAAAWDTLRAKVGGRLIEVTSPVAACRADTSASLCTEALRRLDNPYFIQAQAGGTQTNGWLDGWTAEISPYAVAAQSASDIAAAIDFAREENVKLVVKGAGHDYKGRSSAADSLLVWTHAMRDVRFHESFRPTGAPSTARGVAALSVGAGTRWIDAYQAATARGHYVQGGGCTTVGAAGGFLQGGGYGSFSKRFGTGAGNVLELEVVTADGKLRVANETQNADLFWALRGGGGGTFGIVTKATLLAHPMPKTFGILRGRLAASTDEAFRKLLTRFVAFFPGALNNPSWGEQIAVKADNSLELLLMYLDLTEAEARQTWQPLVTDLEKRPADFEVDMRFDTHPFAGLWDAAFWKRTEPGLITMDDRPDAIPGTYWWSTNQGEVAEFIYSYQSRWIPRSLFEPDGAPTLVRTLFDASRHAPVRLQINKGLSGAAPDAIARDRKTSIHPAVFDAATIVIIASRAEHAFPGIPGHEPDDATARASANAIGKAMAIIKKATPGAGTYGNESDFFESDWKETFYGEPYARLLEIKRKYDPTNLFRVHQGVGSDL